MSEVATDEIWPRIKAQLADKKWNFRTAKGLAKAVHASEHVIEATLAEHSDEIRVARSEKYPGEKLYTLKDRDPTAFEYITTIKRMIGG